MSRPWERPYECDEWKITTSYIGETRFRRKPKFRATAIGYRGGESHATYFGDGFFDDPVIGETREEAERMMRQKICDAIRAYANWRKSRDYQTKVFKMTEVCPED